MIRTDQARAKIVPKSSPLFKLEIVGKHEFTIVKNVKTRIWL